MRDDTRRAVYACGNPGCNKFFYGPEAQIRSWRTWFKYPRQSVFVVVMVMWIRSRFLAEICCNRSGRARSGPTLSPVQAKALMPREFFHDGACNPNFSQRADKDRWPCQWQYFVPGVPAAIPGGAARQCVSSRRFCAQNPSRRASP